jgi:hypothetical protein
MTSEKNGHVNRSAISYLWDVVTGDVFRNTSHTEDDAQESSRIDMVC